MHLASTALLLASIGFLPADDKKDEDAIKGKWVAVTIKFGGDEAPAELTKSFKFDFDGKEYKYTGADQSEEGGYKIDSSKSPKTIDFEIKSGNDKGKKQLGLYKLDGGKLTIIASPAGESERPKSFEPQAGMLLIVLERDKS